MTASAKPCEKCGTKGGYKRKFRKTPERAKGLCQACYLAAKYVPKEKKPDPVKPCIDCGTKGGAKVKGQRRPRRARGRCIKCYQAWHRAKHGRIPDAEATARQAEAERVARLIAVVERDARIRQYDPKVYRLLAGGSK